jgi:hypothetical protein
MRRVTFTPAEPKNIMEYIDRDDFIRRAKAFVRLSPNIEAIQQFFEDIQAYPEKYEELRIVFYERGLP